MRGLGIHGGARWVLYSDKERANVGREREVAT